MFILLIVITLLFLLAALGEKDKDRASDYLCIFALCLVLSVAVYLVG